MAAVDPYFKVQGGFAVAAAGAAYGGNALAAAYPRLLADQDAVVVGISGDNVAAVADDNQLAVAAHGFTGINHYTWGGGFDRRTCGSGDVDAPVVAAVGFDQAAALYRPLHPDSAVVGALARRRGRCGGMAAGVAADLQGLADKDAVVVQSVERTQGGDADIEALADAVKGIAGFHAVIAFGRMAAAEAFAAAACAGGQKKHKNRAEEFERFHGGVGRVKGGIIAKPPALPFTVFYSASMRRRLVFQAA